MKIKQTMIKQTIDYKDNICEILLSICDIMCCKLKILNCNQYFFEKIFIKLFKIIFISKGTYGI